MDRRILELVEPLGKDTHCQVVSLTFAFGESPFNFDIVYQTGVMVDGAFLSSGVDTFHAQDNPDDIEDTPASIFEAVASSSMSSLKASEECLISEGIANEESN